MCFVGTLRKVFSRFSRRCLMEPTQKKNGGRRCVGPRLHDVSSMGQGPELGRERERENKTKYEYTIPCKSE